MSDERAETEVWRCRYCEEQVGTSGGEPEEDCNCGQNEWHLIVGDGLGEDHSEDPDSLTKDELYDEIADEAGLDEKETTAAAPLKRQHLVELLRHLRSQSSEREALQEARDHLYAALNDGGEMDNLTREHVGEAYSAVAEALDGTEDRTEDETEETSESDSEDGDGYLRHHFPVKDMVDQEELNERALDDAMERFGTGNSPIESRDELEIRRLIIEDGVARYEVSHPKLSSGLVEPI